MEMEDEAIRAQVLTPAPKIPAVPNMTPGGTALTEEGLAKAIGLLVNKPKQASSSLGLVPRIGGKCAHGYFVGLGANNFGQEPRTRLCMRSFACDLIKGF